MHMMEISSLMTWTLRSVSAEGIASISISPEMVQEKLHAWAEINLITGFHTHHSLPIIASPVSYNQLFVSTLYCHPSPCMGTCPVHYKTALWFQSPNPIKTPHCQIATDLLHLLLTSNSEVLESCILIIMQYHHWMLYYFQPSLSLRTRRNWYVFS